MDFQGKIIKVFAQKNDWGCIKFVDAKTKISYTAKGTFKDILIPDTEIELTGEFVTDPKYGKQIVVSESRLNESRTVTFLYKCINGIGITAAREIVKMYGENCIEKIVKNPDCLLLVKGIKKKKLKMIVSSLEDTDDIEFYTSIFDFFNNDISYGQATKIIRACKGSLSRFEMIKKNPYWLISHIDGFGFKTVDHLAKSSGIDEYSKERISAAIIYQMKNISVSDGHVFMYLEPLTKEVARLLIEKPEKLTKKAYEEFLDLLASADDELFDFIEKSTCKKQLNDYIELFDKILPVMSDSICLNVEEKTMVVDGNRLYLKELYDAEVITARIICDMIKKPPVKEIEEWEIDLAISELEEEEKCSFTTEQIEAVTNSLKSRLSVITGGPGRGKTTIIKAIMRAWDDDDSLILLAPTGKAAKRMEEVTGHQASTIHRFRGSIKSSKTNPFEEETLVNKCVIIDEISMAGIMMAKTIFEMFKDCMIIFVGDVDQLASIEPGRFLKDMVMSVHIPTSYLIKGFRNASSIAKNADLINHGKSTKEYILDEETRFIEASGEEIIKETISLYLSLLKEYNPVDIIILSPIKAKGYGGVERLNKEIRDVYNPATSLNPDNLSGFRIGDRIMNIKNDYEKSYTTILGQIEKGVFNGDTGTVIEIEPETELLTVEFDDGKVAEYKFSESQNMLIFAYAISIHKSQGSQYKAAIVIVSSEHSFFYKRNLLYTAVTRPSRFLAMIGSKETAGRASRKIDDSQRNSYLVERINKISGKRIHT